ncbi:MAG: hypothetical protein Fur0032_20880 [Terrimicrobiaceae bacterium]
MDVEDGACVAIGAACGLPVAADADEVAKDLADQERDGSDPAGYEVF